jgi:hypothetical protein
MLESASWAQREVDAFIDQVHRPVEQQKPRGNRRTGIEEGVEDRSQHHLSRQHGRRERQRAARRRPVARGDGIGLFEFSQDPSARCRIAFTGLAQFDRPRRAVQKLRADMRLEESDRAADRRGRTAELATRGCETSFVERHDKDLHRIDTVHQSSRKLGGALSRHHPAFNRRAEECLPDSVYSLASRNNLALAQPIGTAWADRPLVPSTEHAGAHDGYRTESRRHYRRIARHRRGSRQRLP